MNEKREEYLINEVAKRSTVCVTLCVAFILTVIIATGVAYRCYSLWPYLQRSSDSARTLVMAELLLIALMGNLLAAVPMLQAIRLKRLAKDVAGTLAVTSDELHIGRLTFTKDEIERITVSPNKVAIMRVTRPSGSLVFPSNWIPREALNALRQLGDQISTNEKRMK